MQTFKQQITITLKLVILKIYYNYPFFSKYDVGSDEIGLMWDDTIYENDDIKEAIRSLPENLYNYRMSPP